MNKTKKLLIIAVFPALFCTSCFKKTVNNNVKDYAKILKNCRDESDFHTELYIFPESVGKAKVNAFQYAHRDDLFTGSFLLYLSLQYDEQTFNTELQRISSVKATYKDGKTKSIIPFEDKNLYLTVKQETRFEYVIYNKSSLEIAYVSNQIFEWKDTPVKSEHILPSVEIPKELDDKDNMYNMYYSYNGDVGLYIED